MTDQPQGHGWWQAADLKWYPPELHADYVPPLPSPPILPHPPKLPPTPVTLTQPPVTAKCPPGQRKVGFVLVGLVLLAIAVMLVAPHLIWDFATGFTSWRLMVGAALLIVVAIAIIGASMAVRSGQSPARTVVFVGVIAIVLVVFALPVVYLGPRYLVYRHFFNSFEKRSSSSSGGGGSSTGTPSAGAGTASPQQNRVLVDGQDQGVVTDVRCKTFSGGFVDGINIKVAWAADHGVFVDLTYPADPPGVKKVFFDNINGATLKYESGNNQGNAEATKQGSAAGSWGNSYKITGTASTPNGEQKSFEIDATCPVP